jgi:hypothetical protein
MRVRADVDTPAAFAYEETTAASEGWLLKGQPMASQLSFIGVGGF